MTAIPATLRIPRVRWGIGVLLGAGVLINYFDRINLSVGAPQLQQEFGLTDGQLGWLFSGFFWSYALLQIPSGMILDRFGVTAVYRISSFLWSLTSAMTALAGGFGGVLAARLLLGVAEGPGFPASAKATGYWFPRGERAMATSIFDAAAKFANVIGVPLVALAVVQFGWRWGFGITGMLSLLYFLAFLIVYRDPSRHPRLSSAERDYIRAGGATREGPAESGEVAMLGYLLRNRKVWGLTIGFSAYGYSFYLFLTWLPNYLQAERGMSMLKSGALMALPFLGAVILTTLIGKLSDTLLTEETIRTGGRRRMAALSMLGGSLILLTPLVGNVYVILFLIMIALSGVASTVAMNIALVSDLLRSSADAGRATGLLILGGNIFGILAPIVTGYVIQTTGNFDYAFVVAGGLLVIGALAVFMLARKPIGSPAAEISLSARAV